MPSSSAHASCTYNGLTPHADIASAHTVNFDRRKKKRRTDIPHSASNPNNAKLISSSLPNSRPRKAESFRSYPSQGFYGKRTLGWDWVDSDDEKEAVVPIGADVDRSSLYNDIPQVQYEHSVAQDEDDELILYDDHHSPSPVQSSPNPGVIQLDDDVTQQEGDDDLLLDDDEVDTSNLTKTVYSTPPLKTSVASLQNDEASKFDELMRRHEAIQRAEYLSDLAIETGIAKDGDNDEAPTPEPTQTADMGHQHVNIMGSSLASTSSSRSVKLVEELIDDEERRRQQAIVFLECLVLDLLRQIDTSLKLLNQRSEPSRKSTYRREGVLDEDPGSDDEEKVEEENNGVKHQETTSGSSTLATGVKIALRNRQTGNDQNISFPDDPLVNGSRDSSASKLACVYSVAVALYDAILNRTVVTLRDIFYRDKSLFKRQEIVDKLVDDLVATAGLKRRDFYVCASAKGLVTSSAISIWRRSGEEVVLSATNGTLIDPIEKIDRIEATAGLAWVLIVEKDAVFQTLCSTQLLLDTRLGPGILVTGKGYPDLATRQFLRLIANIFPNVKFFALVDADPHGLSILSTYKFGSKKTRYSHDHFDLALGDRLEWLGLKASDWKRLGIRLDDLLPLEKVDVRLATSMLKRHDELPTEWKRELSNMLHINCKAEIEIILGTSPSINPSEDKRSFGSIFDAARNDCSPKATERQHGGSSQLIEYIVPRLQIP